MVTTRPATIMGLDHLGLEVGKSASLVLLDAKDPVEVIRRRPVRTHVISRGQVIARTAQPEVQLAPDLLSRSS